MHFLNGFPRLLQRLGVILHFQVAAYELQMASHSVNRLLHRFHHVSSSFPFHRHQSAAIKRRSRCGSVRGSSALSAHFSPRAAWPVGQRTSCTCLRVGLLVFTPLMMRQPAPGNWSNPHSELGWLTLYRRYTHCRVNERYGLFTTVTRAHRRRYAGRPHYPVHLFATYWKKLLATKRCRNECRIKRGLEILPERPCMI